VDGHQPDHSANLTAKLVEALCVQEAILFGAHDPLMTTIRWLGMGYVG